jgi:hypothetical protein
MGAMEPIALSVPEMSATEKSEAGAERLRLAKRVCNGIAGQSVRRPSAGGWLSERTDSKACLISSKDRPGWSQDYAVWY